MINAYSQTPDAQVAEIHESIPSISAPERVLSIKSLDVSFRGQSGLVPAVKKVDLTISSGECLGIVGESGSGKSTVCAAIMHLLPKTSVVEGQIFFRDVELAKMSDRELTAIRGREIAMVFQDPINSLNPIRRIGDQIADRLTFHRGMSRTSAFIEAARLLEMVHIPGKSDRLNDFPFELSGGLCQRVMIAMALACRPKLLIADEPTTALDVTIQAQIVALIGELRRELEMAIILVSHDLGVIARSSDRIAVMYSGEVVEQGRSEDVLHNPANPYTRSLIAAYRGSATIAVAPNTSIAAKTMAQGAFL
ncbi:ABC transporter ATP-binding protein [Rhizobium sp.]